VKQHVNKTFNINTNNYSTRGYAWHKICISLNKLGKRDSFSLLHVENRGLKHKKRSINAEKRAIRSI